MRQRDKSNFSTDAVRRNIFKITGFAAFAAVLGKILPLTGSTESGRINNSLLDKKPEARINPNAIKRIK